MALNYNAAAQALRGGDRLMITHPDPNLATGKTVYGLVGSGKTISATAYRKLRPNLRAARDGLFGEEMSQTFEWIET